MPKMTRNDFLQRHPAAYCLRLGFLDYVPGHRFKNGQDLPSPVQIATQLAKQLKCDYAVSSERNTKRKGCTIMIADQGEANALARKVGASKQNNAGTQECLESAVAVFDIEKQIRLGAALGLNSLPESLAQPQSPAPTRPKR